MNTSASPPGGSLALRATWVVALVLVAVPLLFRALRLLGIADDERLLEVVDYLFDDGYYYLQIAANLAETGRSSFDGMTLTNGYQPLWLMVLAALAAVVGTAPRTFYLAACLLIYAIAIGSVLVPGLRRAPGGGVLPLAVGLALTTLCGSAIFVEGLEEILFLPLAIPLVLAVDRAGEGRGLIALSGWLALAFLVRLDALALFVTVGLVVIGLPLLQRRIRKRDSIQRAVLLGCIVLPVVAVYAVLNQWLFASAVPVSGLAKAMGAPSFANWGVAFDYFDGLRFKVLGPLLVAAVALEVIARRSGASVDGRYLRTVAALFLAVPLQAFYYGAFSGWYVWPWYMWASGLLTAVVAARVVYVASRLEGGLRLVGALGLLLVVGRIGLDATRSWQAAQPPATPWSAQPVTAFDSFNRVSLAMLRDFPPKRDEKTWFAMGDRAGGIAYWGRDRLSIAQTEGLVLDRGWIRARASGGGEVAEAYLLRNFPIDWFVVDRQFVPTVKDPSGEPVYVVADPIQGRVTRDEVPMFCFAQDAVGWSTTYAKAEGPTQRLAFDFSKRRVCSAEARAMIRQVELTTGLRRLSLPGEYEGDAAQYRRREARDRALLYNSRSLQGPAVAPLQESP